MRVRHFFGSLAVAAACGACGSGDTTGRTNGAGGDTGSGGFGNTLGGGGSAVDDCTGDLNACAANETCWPNGDRFECLEQGLGRVGEPCVLADGVAGCHHGLFCFAELSSPERAQCTPQCTPDDDSPCGGPQCVQFRITDVGEISACIPE